MFTLKELCAALDVSRRTIQGYEKAGLLRATGKNKYGYLLYDEASLNRAKQIRFLQNLGFQLSEIKILLEASEAQLREALEVKDREVAQQIDRLQALRRETKSLLDQLANM